MALTFFVEPQNDNAGKPSPDCYACNNGCCGTNTNKKNEEFKALEADIKDLAQQLSTPVPTPR